MQAAVIRSRYGIQNKDHAGGCHKPHPVDEEKRFQTDLGFQSVINISSLVLIRYFPFIVLIGLQIRLQLLALDQDLVFEVSGGGDVRDVLAARVLVEEVSQSGLHDVRHAVLLGDAAMVLYGEDHWEPI